MVDQGKVVSQKKTFGEHWRKYWRQTPEDWEREKEQLRSEREQIKMNIANEESFNVIDNFQDQ